MTDWYRPRFSLVQVTQPTSEPLTRNQVKVHLRLDTADAAINQTQSIAFTTNTTVAGTGVDISGSRATLLLNATTFSAAALIGIDHSANGSTWTQHSLSWTKQTDGSVQTAFATTDSGQYQHVYTGSFQYVRASATTGAGTFGVNVLEQTLQTDEDDLLDALIRTARERAETVQRRALLTQKWRMTMDEFPCWNLNVPMPPLIAGSSNIAIGYIDTNGSTQTMATTDYLVDTDSLPARVTPRYGGSWPSTRDQLNAVTINFWAGSTATTDIPASTLSGMRLLIGHWYENREEVVTGTIRAEMPFAAKMLLEQGEYGSYI